MSSRSAVVISSAWVSGMLILMVFVLGGSIVGAGRPGLVTEIEGKTMEAGNREDIYGSKLYIPGCVRSTCSGGETCYCCQSDPTAVECIDEDTCLRYCPPLYVSPPQMP